MFRAWLAARRSSAALNVRLMFLSQPEHIGT
jgi:hypothetical protein